ncbi:TetR/AcrR family transcriptional regulator [Jiangella endophytica]|uniref:TetR/AcrR family transcriptional regulator n=1 Tax=Jiangella endophytica TaxID=1623398 RepID=UPI0018E5193A|nr:TetR/AcrR family transcriptional regulator [Jiangella endophytica]
MVTDPGTTADGTIQLLWGLREGPTRGPKPVLSLERIAQAAVDLADAEGLAAVSMQRVAADLDFTKMSLYRYVTGKDELVAAMIDLAVGEPPALGELPGTGWRPRIEAWVRLLGQTWEAHPWLPWVTMGDRVMGPNETAWTELLAAVLARTGLTVTERMSLARMLGGHVRTTMSVSTAGTQPWVNPRQAALLREHADRFPTLRAMLDDDLTPPPDNGRDFGLRLILDGVERLIAARAG